MRRYALITGGAIVVIALALGLALVLPQRESIYDFIMLYSASLGVIHRVPIYDHAAITALTIAQLNAPDSFAVFPYPYPPWVALSAFYLGFLPLYKAVNAWMCLNIAMLAASVWLLTSGWEPIRRILTILAALIFIPALGLIVVGQYSAPVLLGASLFIWAARQKDAPLTTLGLLLLTFKPHIGLILLPVGFLWLVFRKTDFARRAIWFTLGGSVLLGTVGFLADPAWPLTYIRSLLSYTSLPGVAKSDLLASFSVMFLRFTFGEPGISWAAWVSLAIVIIISLLCWRFRVFTNVEMLITGCVLMTLLGDPYLLNYDYTLLLLPLIYLAGQAKNLAPRLILGAVYLLPWSSLVFARNANIFYALSAIVLVAMLLWASVRLHNDDDAHISEILSNLQGGI
jgi:hypothetical protein